MNAVKFTETIFKDKSKKGIIKPDADGYYTLNIGALNAYNSVSEYYTASKAKQLFTDSSIFMRRVKNGALYSELGHPKRAPGMSMDDYYRRVITIEETNVCAHIAEVWLDFDFGKKNPHLNRPEMIAIVGKVAPAGPNAEATRISLESSRQNTAFSVRGLNDVTMNNGRTEKELTSIITFDLVIEPGISIADKSHAPGLESLDSGYVLKEHTDMVIDKDVMKRIMINQMKHVSTESSDYNIFQGVLSSIEGTKGKRMSLYDW